MNNYYSKKRKKIKKPRKKIKHRGRMKWLTQKECESLLNSAKLQDRLLIEFLLSSGLRVMEVVSLKKSDLILEKQEGLVIEGKGSKSRKLFYSRNVAKKLKNHLLNKNEKDFVFFYSQDKADV